MPATSPAPPLRIALVGHVQHVTLGLVPALPRDGEIVHLSGLRWLPGGGSGVPFWQLLQGPTEVHFFTAFGDDEAGAQVEAELRATRAHVHAVRRHEAHTRNVVLITPGGERTIIVLGESQYPQRDDPLPWDLLAECDAAFFTARDPEALRAARAARVLVAATRRRDAIVRSGVRVDVALGSAADEREVCRRTDFHPAPSALVLTEGGAGGTIETAAGVERFAPPPPVARRVGSYGAGDSFAAALTFFLAAGLGVRPACDRAGAYGAAVLSGIDPRDHQLRLERP
jgi:ribokinase